MERKLSRITIENQYIPENRLDLRPVKNPWGISPHLAETQVYMEHTSPCSVREQIAGWLKLTPENIALHGNGSSAIITEIPRLFMHADDTCLIVQPTYFGFTGSLEDAGMHILEVRNRQEYGFAFNDQSYMEIIAAIDRVRPSLVWLCNPNNPTGLVMDRKFISYIASSYPESLVVIDEAHWEIIDPLNKDSAVRLISTLPNILVTKTFSKAFGLSDIRIGISVSNPERIRMLSVSEDTNPIPCLALDRAAAALLDLGHLVATTQKMRQELEYVKNEVKRLKRIELGSDSQIGILIMKHTGIPLYDLLLKQGIQTDDFNAVRGLEGLGFVRIGLGRHEDNIQLVEALRICDQA